MKLLERSKKRKVYKRGHSQKWILFILMQRKGHIMLESQHLIAENSLDRDLYSSYLAQLSPHLETLLAVYSEELFRYEKHARGNRKGKNSFNPFSKEFLLRASPEDLLLRKIQTHWGALSEEAKETYPLLSRIESTRFVDLNRALVIGAEKIGHLTYRQKFFLDDYVRKNSIFQFPFNIKARGMNTRHSEGGGHYAVSIVLPLPPEELTPDTCSKEVHAFVKDFKTLEDKEKEERMHMFAESAGCNGPKILFSYNKILIYEYGEEEISPLAPVRDHLRGAHGYRS